jgi:hypothetical protein
VKSLAIPCDPLVNNDSLPPKYTIFHHLAYVAKVVHHLNLFLKNKKTQKVVGGHLAT